MAVLGLVCLPGSLHGSGDVSHHRELAAVKLLPWTRPMPSASNGLRLPMVQQFDRGHCLTCAHRSQLVVKPGAFLWPCSFCVKAPGLKNHYEHMPLDFRAVKIVRRILKHL